MQVEVLQGVDGRCGCGIAPCYIDALDGGLVAPLLAPTFSPDNPNYDVACVMSARLDRALELLKQAVQNGPMVSTEEEDADEQQEQWPPEAIALCESDYLDVLRSERGEEFKAIVDTL